MGIDILDILSPHRPFIFEETTNIDDYITGSISINSEVNGSISVQTLITGRVQLNLDS